MKAEEFDKLFDAGKLQQTHLMLQVIPLLGKVISKIR